MQRRNFLRLLTLGVTGHVLDLDKFLWVPGAKKIFIPLPQTYYNLRDALEVAKPGSIPLIINLGLSYTSIAATSGPWLGFDRLRNQEKQ